MSVFPSVLGLIVSAVMYAQATRIQPIAVQEQGVSSHKNWMQELHEIARPAADGHFDVGWVWVPHPGQAPLQTEYGAHEGFPYRHRVALYLAHPLEKSPWRIGASWISERFGWAHSDFLFLRPKGTFDQGSSLHGGGLFLANAREALQAGGGVHHQSGYHPWTLLSWRWLGLTSTWNAWEWESARFTLELESREIWGGNPESRWRYAPDLAVLVEREGRDRVQLQWRQNIYDQHWYVESRWRPQQAREADGLLIWYPDPGHLISMELGGRRLSDGSVFFGGGMQVPFVRVSYSHPRDYDRFFRTRGLWLMEFTVQLGSVRDRFFYGRNAPRPSPMEEGDPVLRRTRKQSISEEQP